MLSSATSFLKDGAEGRVDPISGRRLVVARRDIARDEVIAVFGGEVLSRAELEALGPNAIRSTIQVEEDLYLYSTTDGPADWINHSCAPNAGMRGQIGIVAMRRIRAGEEICFDYAMSDASEYDEFDCECGSPDCRQRIRSEDWQRPALWQRYRGYFSPYIERKIQTARSSAGVHRQPGD